MVKRNMVRMTIKKVEVVVGSALENERRFEVLSPEGNLVVYAGKKYLSYVFFKKKLKLIATSATEEERDNWTSEIRSQDSIICFSLRDQSRWNSTLTSSVSTNDIRRSLQALPFLPSDDRLGTLCASCSNLYVIRVLLSPNGK